MDDRYVFNVVSFEGFKIGRRASRGGFGRKSDDCKHDNLEADDDGQLVRCTDCKAQVSNYWVLMKFMRLYEEARDKLQRERTQLREDESKAVVLRAAQKIQHIWRGKMLPCCPHCHRGIGPNDGFGNNRMNPKFEQKRRTDAKPTQGGDG